MTLYAMLVTTKRPRIANGQDKRLPTEAEWEKAACWNEEKAGKNNFSMG